MRSTRISVAAAMLSALALPVLSATTASAEAAAVTAVPASGCNDLPPLPYAVHATAVTIQAKASSKPTAVGVLNKSRKFSVSKKSGNWLYITHKSTGWVSGTYVYRDVRMCLD